MIDRRTILKGLTAIPILAVLGALTASLISYLKPTNKPLALPQTEKPLSKDLTAATLEEFPKDYDFKEFIYTQETVEYSDRGKQATDVLGYIVRIPNDKLDPTQVGLGANGLRKGFGVAEHNGQKYSMVVISRICAHLGCIFEYHVPADVCSRFNYCGAQNNQFSCPCHLSVYDPAQSQDVSGFGLLPGKVVSGPAPRTPFPFDFEIQGQDIIIKGYS